MPLSSTHGIAGLHAAAMAGHAAAISEEARTPVTSMGLVKITVPLATSAHSLVIHFVSVFLGASVGPSTRDTRVLPATPRQVAVAVELVLDLLPSYITCLLSLGSVGSKNQKSS